MGRPEVGWIEEELVIALLFVCLLFVKMVIDFEDMNEWMGL